MQPIINKIAKGKCLLVIIALMCTMQVLAQGTPRHGKVMIFNGEQKAWHQTSQTWLSLEQFWLAYADEGGGLTWGKTDTYPAYDQVKEFDTILMVTPDGQCLLEFFHERWRRANDVRRWDKAFNEFSGCASVFDY